MKFMKKTAVLAALAAFTLSAQAPVAKPATTATVTPTAPTVQLDTAKIWRLVSELTTAQANLRASEVAVKDAKTELDAEQSKLVAACAARNQVLSIDQDPQSPRFKDIKCADKPKETAAAPEPKK
jgi:Skp family chaperone for outer membrane proteins